MTRRSWRCAALLLILLAVIVLPPAWAADPTVRYISHRFPMLESGAPSAFLKRMPLRRAYFFLAILALFVGRLPSQTNGTPARPAPVEDECAVRQSTGAGRTVLLSFSGEVWAGGAYHCDFTPRLTFALLPVHEGWQIAVTDRGRADNLAQFSEPVIGFNPLLI